ncbi:MAG: hypothetical protein HY678_12120 [Chloroflexi bacterium]|nr:hypothetical protein [Chloroflexota bacterium]
MPGPVRWVRIAVLAGLFTLSGAGWFWAGLTETATPARIVRAIAAAAGGAAVQDAGALSADLRAGAGIRNVDAASLNHSAKAVVQSRDTQSVSASSVGGVRSVRTDVAEAAESTRGSIGHGQRAAVSLSGSTSPLVGANSRAGVGDGSSASSAGGVAHLMRVIADAVLGGVSHVPADRTNLTDSGSSDFSNEDVTGIGPNQLSTAFGIENAEAAAIAELNVLKATASPAQLSRLDDFARAEHRRNGDSTANLGESVAAAFVPAAAPSSQLEPSHQRLQGADPGRLFAVARTSLRSRRSDAAIVRASVEVRVARHRPEDSAGMTAAVRVASQSGLADTFGHSAYAAAALGSASSERQLIADAATFQLRRSEASSTQTGPQPRTDTVVIPESPPGSGDALREVIAVLRPDSPVTLEIPEFGIRLEVPARGSSTILQARLAVQPPDSVAVKPDAEVLRLIRIELFDQSGRLLEGGTVAWPVHLSISLAPNENRDGADGSTLRLLRLGAGSGGPSWEPVSSEKDLVLGVVSARLDHLSLFALVRERGMDAATDSGQTRAVARSAGVEVESAADRSGPARSWATRLAVLVGISVAAGLALRGGIEAWRRQRR